MSLSEQSIITTCLWNSVLILLLCFLARRSKIVQKVGPGCLIIVLLATIIRMFFPFEFWYTYDWHIEDILMPIVELIHFQVLAAPIVVRVWEILMIMWLVGVIISLIFSIRNYRKICRYTSILPKKTWEEVLGKYHLPKEEFAGIEKITLAYSKQVQSPCIIGMWHPCLVMPEKEYTAEQVRYILMHEWMHVKNRDIFWKTVIDLLCCAFWWNPVFRYLKRELFQLIEMRNDSAIVSSLSEKEVVYYMEALVETAGQVAGKDVAFGVSFKRGSESELNRRMCFLRDKKVFRRSQQAIVYICVAVMLFLTSAVIIEPYSLKKAGDEGIPLTSANTFLVISEDGYEVYVDGVYITTMPDLTGFDGINIYESLEEAMENE